MLVNSTIESGDSACATSSGAVSSRVCFIVKPVHQRQVFFLRRLNWEGEASAEPEVEDAIQCRLSRSFALPAGGAVRRAATHGLVQRLNLSPVTIAMIFAFAIFQFLPTNRLAAQESIAAQEAATESTESESSDVAQPVVSESVDENDSKVENQLANENESQAAHAPKTWISKESYVEGDDEYVLVKTDDVNQFAAHYKALMAIDPAIEKAVAAKIDKWFGVGAGRIADIDDKEVIAPLVQHKYVQTYEIKFDEEDAERFASTTEEFYRGYAQLKFDSDFHRLAEKRWKRNLTRNRLIYAASLGGALLCILGVVYGFLHCNHLTRGFYVGKLQTIAIVNVVLIIALAYYATRVFVPQ